MHFIGKNKELIYLQKILFIFFIIFISSCTNVSDFKSENKIQKKYFTSKGFALVYEDSLYDGKVLKKRINNDEYVILHSFLKKNSHVRVINPDNSKFIDAKVIARTDYPSIFSAVISKQIANDLNLNMNNPYIEIEEIKKNKKFIAKKSNTFEEEKNVAENAPVTEITMDVISDESNKKKKIEKEFIFFIAISDFYYSTTATDLKNNLINKTKFSNILVKKINDNKYRLLVGPFKNFNALKSSYISLNNLGFEGLNIYRE